MKILDIERIYLLLFDSLLLRKYDIVNKKVNIMALTSEFVGNPTSILIERLAYLSIGIFFTAAFYTGIKRNLKDK